MKSTRSGWTLAALLLAGCAAKPVMAPWSAEALIAALPERCSTDPAQPATEAAAVVAGGLSVVRSAGRDVIVVAGRGCVLTVDAATGAAELLPTRGDSIAPTMVDATSDGVAFSSSLSGSVRVLDTAGAVTFNVSALHTPLGVRLMPGGTALVAEFATGRILRLGPESDSRPRLIAHELQGPVGLVVVDATRGYVTEMLGGRVTEFRLDRFETKPVAKGLDRPEGLALLPNGRLLVAEVGLRRLVSVDPATGKVEVMADNLPIGLESAAGATDANAVTDVVAAADGRIFMSADIDRTILRVMPRPAPQAP
jgi:streptogramin lyase